MESKSKLAIRSILKDLRGKRARHTELISVYVPPSGNLVVVKQQLAQEQGTAENIKSKQTRKNVQAALERMIRQLDLYKHTPANGLAIFSGNVSEKEGGSDLQVWAIEPPEPVSLKLYKCDQVFHLEPLERMLEPKHTYELIVIDAQEGSVAILRGTQIIPVYDADSMVPGKTRAGGQSALRFARVREGMLRDFLKQIADIATKEFRNRTDIKGILIGGPGPTKDDLINSSFLSSEVKDKIIGVRDVGYTGLQGLKELVEKSEDILAKEEILLEKKEVARFFEVLNKKPDHAAYGKSEVEKAMNMGAVDTLLISEDVDAKEADELATKIEEQGGKWLLISTDTAEGKQIASLSGLCAVLRFAIG